MLNPPALISFAVHATSQATNFISPLISSISHFTGGMFGHISSCAAEVGKQIGIKVLYQIRDAILNSSLSNSLSAGFQSSILIPFVKVLLIVGAIVISALVVAYVVNKIVENWSSICNSVRRFFGYDNSFA
jgi:hypothetical protein